VHPWKHSSIIINKGLASIDPLDVLNVILLIVTEKEMGKLAQLFRI
jgi:hypothetical protein